MMDLGTDNIQMARELDRIAEEKRKRKLEEECKRLKALEKAFNNSLNSQMPLNDYEKKEKDETKQRMKGD